MLAVAYEKTQELARDLRAVGCGDLDVEGNELTLHIVGSLNRFFFSLKIINKIFYDIRSY